MKRSEIRLVCAFSLSAPIILSTFGIIFIAELPDKSALASVVLATKYKAPQVILGIWLAFLVQTAISVFAGSIIGLLPPEPVHIAAGLGFIIFGVIALRRKAEKVEEEEKTAVSKIQKTHRAVWLTSFLVIFAAEWGDLTQLATAALVARIGNPASVFIGALAALWTVTIAAVIAGSLLGKVLSPRKINIISGILFIIIGLFLIITALQS